MIAKDECDRRVNGSQVEAEPDVLREMVRTMVQEVLEEEVTAHVGAEPHERTDRRRGYRNGHKPRHWKTRVGELALDVPQARGIEPYQPSFFARWERSERALLAACAEMYFLGVSTRRVAKVLEEMGGFSLSAATVSKVASELDSQLEAFRSRRLDHCDWPYLLVDARYEKVRQNKRIVSVAVLVVAGLSDRGRREVLTWRTGDSESLDTWGAVFADLKRRGLGGTNVLISDAHEGIRAAADREFPGVSWQRCRTHFMREALAKVSHKERNALAKDLQACFYPEDPTLCRQAAEEVAARWVQKAPRVSKMLESGFEDCLTVQALPKSQRRRLHSTNMLERLMRELKRRTRVVGIFPNVASLERLIGAMLVETDEAWQCERMRYVVLDRD